MIFFIIILLLSMLLGIYIIYEDKKYNNILESVVVYETENVKSNYVSILNKSLSNDNNENMNEEEKKLLHISKLI